MKDLWATSYTAIISIGVIIIITIMIMTIIIVLIIDIIMNMVIVKWLYYLNITIKYEIYFIISFVSHFLLLLLYVNIRDACN